MICTLTASANYTVGLPASATVNIADDDSGGGLPTVTITASDANAAEPSDTGTFTVARTGATTTALAVNFAATGTATSGTDYTAIGTSVSIPIGQASATITILIDPIAGKTSNLYKNVITKREKAAVSIMPPGLLYTLTAEEVADLLALFGSAGIPDAGNPKQPPR